ncbi:septum formation family protein [Dactylosporangium sp. CA-139114]|uniref:septum formation family protein n=1 Tax=Dactylosporangium sp. CA-139114 TaxID=3239931 RepID=UPI003D98D192
MGTGRFLDGSQVPGWGSGALRATYAECGNAATAYLGADWHNGWLFLHIGRPASADRAAGAHGYVCGIAEFERTDWSAPSLARTGTLKGDLAAAGPGQGRPALCGADRPGLRPAGLLRRRQPEAGRLRDPARRRVRRLHRAAGRGVPGV